MAKCVFGMKNGLDSPHNYGKSRKCNDTNLSYNMNLDLPIR